MKVITLNEVLDKLSNVKSNNGRHTALCPAHDDKKNSLSIKEGSNGQILFKCFAGCSFTDIRAALGLKGTYNGNRDSFKSSRQVVAVYDYRDENGEILYQVVREKPKRFFQRRPDGKGGFINNLDGVRRVLYRLPEILKADSSQTVFICEGEKDADRLAAHNLVATTNSSGAGKWRDEYSLSLQGRHVAILPDNDEAGMEHAKQVARSLYSKAASIRIVDLPDLPDKGDVSDWLDSSGSIEKLLELVESAPTYQKEDEKIFPAFFSWDEFMSIEISDDASIAFTLMRKETGLLSAVTNRGKSTLIRNALLMLACGKPFSPFVEAGKPRRVLLLDFETIIERLKPDLSLMACDLTDDDMRCIRENFFVMCEGQINDEPISLSQHMKEVERYAKSNKIDLIAVDTLTTAFDLNNENDNAEILRKALKPLKELARKVKAALIAVHHIGKAGSEGANQSEAAYKARGASSLGCHTTAVFNLYADTSDPKLLKIECAKRKDGKEPFSKFFRLDVDSRWFEIVAQDEQQKPASNNELITEVFNSLNRPLKRSELVKALEGKVTDSSISRWLKGAVEKGIIVKHKHGSYSLPGNCQSEKTEGIQN